MELADQLHIHKEGVRRTRRGRSARDVSGSGLGLSIVHLIAEPHGAFACLHDSDEAGSAGLELRIAFSASP